MLHTKKTFDFEHPISEADIGLLGIPFDSTEIGKSCKYGPLFIRQAIRELIGYNQRTEKNIFKDKKFIDIGDIEVVPGSWKKTQEKIQETLNDMFEENPNIVPAILGGEHLITLAALRTLSKKHDKITVIHFDAHRDLRKDWLGQKYSHLTWAYHALEELPNIDLIQIGQRQWDETEDNYLKEKSIKEKIEDIENPIYITMDLDIFDVTDVGTPEAGGITWQYFLSELEKIKDKKIIGFDIVECAAVTVGEKSAVIGANVFKELVGLI
ncbi:hypothetical protein CL614_00805 [archaeon]|nr:hypothetical protein [archaeon]